MLKRTFRKIAQLETNTLTRRCTRTQADKEAEYIAEPDDARLALMKDHRSEKRSWRIAGRYFQTGAKIRLSVVLI